MTTTTTLDSIEETVRIGAFKFSSGDNEHIKLIMMPVTDEPVGEINKIKEEKSKAWNVKSDAIQLEKVDVIRVSFVVAQKVHLQPEQIPSFEYSHEAVG